MRVHARNDDGQVLGLALAFLIFVALVTAATLTAATTQLHATESLKQQRDARYAADAAMLAATTRMQNDVNAGADRGTPIQPSQACVFPVDFAIEPMHATVTCQPRPGSGVGDGTGSLARRTESSVLFHPRFAATRQPRAKESQRDLAMSRCSARCTRTAVSANWARRLATRALSRIRQCRIPTGRHPFSTHRRRPDRFLLATVGKQPSRKAPTARCLTADVRTWFSSPASTTSTSRRPAHTSGRLRTAKRLSAARRVRRLPHARPSMTCSRMLVSSSCSVAIRGCRSQEVRLSISARSQIPTRQQIAVYGIQANAPGTTDQDLTQSPTTGVNGLLATPYDFPQNAVTSDGTEAHAAVPPGIPASLDLTGFTALPEGSIVKSARLTVKHHEDPAMQSLSLQLLDGVTPVQPPFASAAPCDPSDLTHLCISNDPSHTDSLDVTGAFLDPNNSFFNGDGLANLGLRFTATAPNAGGPYDSFVDGVELDLKLAPAPGSYRSVDRMCGPRPRVRCIGMPIGFDSGWGIAAVGRHRVCADGEHRSRQHRKRCGFQPRDRGA